MRILARLAGLALVVAAFAGAPARAERIRHFDVRVDVESAGTLLVHERIRFDFEGAERHGIYRDIPDRYEREGADFRIRLDVLEVTDGEGNPREHRVRRAGRNTRVRIGDPDAKVSGVQVYALRYRVGRALLYFDNHDELYWNATGTEWDVPIDAAEVEVALPGAEPERDACYTGAFGSRASDCERSRILHGTRIRATRSLGAREGLTVVVGFPKGLVPEPSAADRWLDRARDFLSAGLLLPLLAFGGMFALWRSRGRDPDPGAIPVRYEPPEGLTPAEVGTLVDESADIDDVTSSILDLAVRGFLQIREVESTKFLFLSDTDYELRRTAEPSDLKAHEAKLFFGLFGSGDHVRMSDLKNEFYTKLPGIQTALYERLSADGGYFPTSPHKVRRIWSGIGIACVVLGFVLASGSQSLVTAIGVGVTGLVVAGFGRVMPRKTRRGRRAYEEILGFKEFLARVDRDRLERMGGRTPEQFERILPYAIVLGVSDAWADAFADLYTEPPSWYHGRGHFAPRAFVSDVGHSLQTMGQTLTSQPRGSGGSGFGGGGSSGGGFGGGGGGSW